MSKNFRISFSAGKWLHWKSKNGDLKILYTNCLILTLCYSSVTLNAYNLAPMFTKNRTCYFKIVVTLHIIRIASINLNNVKIKKTHLWLQRTSERIYYITILMVKTCKVVLDSLFVMLYWTDKEKEVVFWWGKFLNVNRKLYFNVFICLSLTDFSKWFKIVSLGTSR